VIQPCEFNGYSISLGWSVLYQIGKTHQDSSIYALRDYEWEIVPEQNLDLVMVPTPHPRDGLQVSLGVYRVMVINR